MKSLVTGAGGFIGKNLCVALKRAGVDTAEVDIESGEQDLSRGLDDAGVVYHLAGVNRPEHEAEYMTGNVQPLKTLLAAIERAIAEGRRAEAPFIVLTSSAQAECDNPYGRSKLAAEALLHSYAGKGGSAAIYRLPGVFGKWCRPGYNSVVATFCHNVARDIPIAVSNPARTIDLVHIDDVVGRLISHLDIRADAVKYEKVDPVFACTLARLASLIRRFRDTRNTLEVPDMGDPFIRRLWGTYQAYLPEGDLAYPLETRRDERGTLAELLKSRNFGQIFISRTRPGIVRGNHFHDSKVEKFFVLEGEAVVCLRSVLGSKIVEYRVSGTDYRVVDIPPGFAHSIQNVGNNELVVLFWASAIFDPQDADTFSSEVGIG